MLYILFGPDDFSLNQELARIKKGLEDGELLEANTIVLDGKQLSPKELAGVCDVTPFLAPKRLVIVEGLLTHFEQRESKREQGQRIQHKPKAKDEWQELSKYVERMSETTVLVLIDGKLKGNNPLLKKLSPVATVKSFPLMRGRRLHDWIYSRVTEYGGSISPQAISLLANLAGGNLWTLANEIEKLSLYASGRTIEEEDVKCVVSYTQEANIFAMVDAVMEGRSSAAMPLLHQLLNEGEPPSRILVMLARQLRLAIIARELDSQRIPHTEIKQRLGISGDYPFGKIMEQARRYPMEQLEWFHGRLLEADLSIKTGKWKAIRAEKWKDEFILDIFVAELCQPA